MYLRAVARLVLAALKYAQFLKVYSLLLDLRISVNLVLLKLQVFVQIQLLLYSVILDPRSRMIRFLGDLGHDGRADFREDPVLCVLSPPRPGHALDHAGVAGFGKDPALRTFRPPALEDL